MSEIHRQEPRPDGLSLTPETIATLKEVGDRLEKDILNPIEGSMQGPKASELFLRYDQLLARLSSGRAEV